MNRTTINATVRNFFDGWHLYKKLVDCNALSHKEMCIATNEILQDKYPLLNFSILDLGCGDAANIAKTLQQFEVSNYTGIDLSSEAIKLAKQNLHFMNKNITFMQCDFIAGMQLKMQQQEVFDVIYTAYALHHYTSQEKQIFFDRAHALLKPDGILIVIDIILEENTTIKKFLSKEIKFLATFPTITTTNIAQLSEHILTYDIPETISTYCNMVTQSGFKDFNVICDKKFFKLFVCYN